MQLAKIKWSILFFAGFTCKLEDIDGKVDIATGTTLTVSFKKWMLRDPVCSLPTK